MPAVQKLHDRYRDRGLTVLAISYEPAAKMAPFLRDNAYTMPVGADPEKKTVAAYGVRGWPTTVVIDKEGNIAHVGSPYEAEAVVEKALGLEGGPGAILTAWLDAQAAPDKAARRAALARLVEKAPPDFDLAAWARSSLPPETVAGEGDDTAPPAPAPTPGAPGEAPAPTPAPAPKAAPAKPAAKPDAKPADAAELLRRCAAGWGTNPAAREPLLRALAGATAPFDLAAFAQQTMAKAHPFDAAELQTLLRGKQFAAVVDAIGRRAPAPAVLATAAKHAELAAFCKQKRDAARDLAKKGLIAQLWLFANALPRDEKLNSALQSELGASGMAMSKDRKSIVGVLLAGEQLQREHADAWIGARLTQAVLMTDLAAGKPPRVRELAKLIAAERSAIVADLERRYGKPVPFPKGRTAAVRAARAGRAFSPGPCRSTAAGS